MQIVNAHQRVLLVRLGFSLVISTVFTSIFAGLFLGLGLLTIGQLFTTFSTNLILLVLFLVFLYIGYLMSEHIGH